MRVRVGQIGKALKEGRHEASTTLMKAPSAARFRRRRRPNKRGCIHDLLGPSTHGFAKAVRDYAAFEADGSAVGEKRKWESYKDT